MTMENTTISFTRMPKLKNIDASEVFTVCRDPHHQQICRGLVTSPGKAAALQPESDQYVREITLIVTTLTLMSTQMDSASDARVKPTLGTLGQRHRLHISFPQLFRREDAL